MTLKRYVIVIQHTKTREKRYLRLTNWYTVTNCKWRWVRWRQRAWRTKFTESKEALAWLLRLKDNRALGDGWKVTMKREDEVWKKHKKKE